ncbi:hypothetical protein HYPGJ_31180 [Hyphomicrobium sp. GJ21]|nr:hypothetical protein HYPGJ_31180 [Hyphomicrobium sp. GJ21]
MFVRPMMMSFAPTAETSVTTQLAYSTSALVEMTPFKRDLYLADRRRMEPPRVGEED